MSEVVSFKVRKDIKERMNRFRDRINWSEELRRFVEAKIRELEAQSNYDDVMKRLKKASWSVPKGYSVRAVREDRDSR